METAFSKGTAMKIPAQVNRNMVVLRYKFDDGTIFLIIQFMETGLAMAPGARAQNPVALELGITPDSATAQSQNMVERTVLESG